MYLYLEENMKKILIFIVLMLLAGCTHNKIAVDRIDLKHENNITMLPPFSFTGKDDKFYYKSTYGELYYYDKDFNALDLGSLFYFDDKKKDGLSSEEINVEKYVDEGLEDIYYYDSKLYFMSYRRTLEKEESYMLNAIDEKGEGRKVLLSLDYYPHSFIIQNGYLIVLETTESFEQKVHIYDQRLKEVKVIEPQGFINRLFVEGDNVYLIDGVSEKGRKGNLILNLKDLSVTSQFLQNNELLVFARDNTYAVRDLDKLFNEVDDPMDITHHSRIYEKETNNIIFEVKNELIGYYDDEYIYTATLNTPNTKFRVYDYNKNLIKEIIPSQSLLREPKIEVIFVRQDFDFIYRIFNNHIITGARNGASFEIVSCSIDTGKCEVIATEAR